MQTTFTYPDEVRIALNLTPDQFVAEMRFAAAAKLYELGRLSSGRAAELAGVSRIRFLHELERYSVPVINLEEAELLQDIAQADPNKP